MADQVIQLSALTAIREQAAADVLRSRKEVDKAQLKLTLAEAKLKTLDETLAQLAAVATPDKSRKDMILDVIKEHDGAGISAREIVDKLKEMGNEITSNNPSASVHVAAEQLHKDGHIDVVNTAQGKLFKPKTASLDL